MASWMKRIEKASRGELRPGERLIAGAFLQPSGTMGKSVAQGVGGVVGGIAGRAIASKIGDSGSGSATAELVTDGGISSTIPDDPSVIGLTEQRMLVYSYGSMSGKPKDLKMWIPASDLVSIDTEKKKATHRFVMKFRDGSTKAFEAPRINNDPESFATIVNSR